MGGRRGDYQGQAIEKFRARFDQVVHQHGWQYKGSSGWRTRVIYETNLRMAHAAGRYRQLKDPRLVQVRPFWQYHHNDNVNFPRQHHVAWDGLIFRHNHP